MGKILVTGARGFIGKNLISELRNRGYRDILEYDMDTGHDLLDVYAKECDFVFHLAGVNRPENHDEFMKGNYGFTATLLNSLETHHNRVPVLATSSIQAILDNPYGVSKKAEEDVIFSYGLRNEVDVFVYRLPNVFGKWCRPNYNSVVATFCYNIANDLPIKINNPDAELNLVYIDDVIREFICALENQITTENDFCTVPITYTAGVGEIAGLIYSFQKGRKDCSIPNMSDSFAKKMYSTYLSYLPPDQFSYPLKMNVDNRGSFTEFIRTADRGQLSINISKPGIRKGNHWHHSKVEKFLVVSGKGIIRFRRIHSDEIIEYCVSGETLEVVDIPAGYTHNIENIGDVDMVTVMWANECFDPENPDTYPLEVSNRE